MNTCTLAGMLWSKKKKTAQNLAGSCLTMFDLNNHVLEEVSFYINTISTGFTFGGLNYFVVPIAFQVTLVPEQK